MSESNDKDPTAKSPDTPSAGDPRPEKRSGRVAFDSRNNPVWEWQLETGVYSRDVNTQKLKKLNLGDLSIAESAIQKQPPGLGNSAKSGQPAQLPGGGFNPYDNSSRPVHADPYDTARAAKTSAGPSNVAPQAARPPTPRRPPTPVPASKPSTLEKIGQWFRGKRKSDEDYE
jgi:hypothetical protein